MKAVLAILAGALLLPAAAQAQGDPWNGNPWAPNGNPWGPQQQQQRGGEDDHDHDRPIYAGDFVLIPQGNDFLLLDSKTGCVWRRSPPPSGFGPGNWEHEFPDFSRVECNERLEQARKNALKEGGN